MADEEATGETVPSCQGLYAEDLLPLEVPVYPAGDPAAFHTQNDPRQPFQRSNIVERKGPVDVRCEHKDIVHGYLSEDSNDLCSMIVLRLRFSPSSTGRRIKQAQVTLTFAAQQRGSEDPEVTAICPDGSFAVEPTQQHETLTRSGGLNIGGNALGAQIGGDLKLEKVTERNTSDAASVRGSIDLVGRSWGPKNSVSWTFLENPTTRSGVITCMQGAILLRRDSMETFTARVQVRIVADTLTRMESVFHSDPEDDDIWYDPKRKPTNKLQKYDEDRIGCFDLRSVCEVIAKTTWKNASKDV